MYYSPVSPSSCAAGVQSVAIEGRERNHLVVVGDGLDAVSLTSYLRKKVGAAQWRSSEAAAPPTGRSRPRPPPPSPRARSTSGNRATAATTTPGRPPCARTRTPAGTATTTTTTPTPTRPRRAPSCDRSAGNRGALLNDNCREILMWLVLVDKARTDSNLSIFNQ